MPRDESSSSRRTQSHARALLGRVYLGGTGIQLVRGRPDVERLFPRFLSWHTPPAEDPSPADLGFAAGDVIPLNRGGLGTRSRSVQRWRAGLEARLSGRISPADRRALQVELAELDRLAGRIAGLHRLFAGPPEPGQSYWLAPEEEAIHEASLHKHLEGRFVPTEVAWLARLVHWIGGPTPLGRFLTTVRGGLQSPAEHALRRAIEHFQGLVTGAIELLPPVESGRPTDPRHYREALRGGEFAAAIARLRRAAEGLPPSLRVPEQLGLPGRDSEIDLRLLRRRCRQVLEGLPEDPPWDALLAVAALYLTDHADATLSWATVLRHVEDPSEAQVLQAGAAEAGYTRLLERLADLPACSLDEFRRLQASGATLEEMIWWAEFDGTRLGEGQRPEAVPAYRRIVEWLRAHGSTLSPEEFTSLWETLATDAGFPLAESLAGFLERLDRPGASLVGAVDGLIRILCVPRLRKPMADRLRAWCEPPSGGRLPADCPDGLPPELGRLLRRLAYYQRLGGEEARVPGSIRRPLELAGRVERELGFLRDLGDRRDPEQAARLQHLETQRPPTPGEATSQVERLVRQAHEVIAITALAAARSLVYAELADWWRSRFAGEPALDGFRWQDLGQLLRWADSLGAAERELVAGILAAHQTHGAAYRRHLSSNAGWLARAVEAIDLDHWLQPPRERVTVGKGKSARSYTLAVASDPRDVFLMGSRFETCLGLRDGLNRDAVIANAADANKAVLSVIADDGTPVARRLVGVTPDWGLVGYRLYSHERSEPLTQAVEAYCGAWAARSGLRLVDVGTPAVLTRRFWYDDGVGPWSAPARAAYHRLRPEEPVPAESADSAALSGLQAAVRTRDQGELEAIQELEPGAGWWAAVAHWRLKLGGDLAPFEPSPPSEASVLFEHLAASGRITGVSDPLHWVLPEEVASQLGHQILWSLFALLPPDRQALSAGCELLNRHQPRDDSWPSRCFSTFRITPALAAVGFRAVLATLRRFVQWAPQHSCGCPQDLRPHWTRVLQLAWHRDPDVGLVAAAIADPEPLVREIFREFCLRQPERRFQQPLRRLLRTLPAGEEPEAVRQALQALQARLANRDESDELESILLGRDSAPSERLEALERLAHCPGRLDAALAAVLCAAWTEAERVAVGTPIRETLVRACAARNDTWEWQVWPLLHWLATLDPDRQAAVLASLTLAEGQDMPMSICDLTEMLEPRRSLEQAVLLQALNHPLAPIREAALSLLRFFALHRPAELELLMGRHAPWIHPDQWDALRADLPGGTEAR